MTGDAVTGEAVTGEAATAATHSVPLDGRRSVDDRSGVPTGMVVLCVAALSICSLILIVTSASLVGDGSYYLLRAVQTRGPFPLPGRLVSNALREGPMLIGLAAGVTNTQVLTVLEGIGFVLLPAVAWSLALVAARRARVQFTLVAVACGLCFASMMLFSVSELTLTLPLVALASVLVTRPDPWSRADAVMVVVVTGLLVLSHESVLPAVVVLMVMAVLRARARLSVTDARVSAAVAVVSGVATAVALWTLVYRPNSNSTDFLTHVEHGQPRSILLLMTGGALLLGWAVLHGRGGGTTWIGWYLAVPGAVLTAFGIRSAITGGPTSAYESRGFCVIVIVVLQLLLLVGWARLRRPDSSDGSDGSDIRRSLPSGAAWGAAAFLVVLMLIPAVGALRWSAVVGAFRTTITTHSGTVPESRVESRLAGGYLWPWTNTTMSVVLRSSPGDAVVLNTIADNPIPIHRAQQQIAPDYTWGR